MAKKAKSRAAINAPADVELEDVLKQLRAPGALCGAKVATSNSGLALSLSFRPSTGQTSSGSLEVALRKAKVHISYAAPTTGWDWNPEFLDFARTQTASVERTISYGEVAGVAKSEQLETKSEFGATIKPLWFEFITRLTVGGLTRRDHKRESSRAKQEKVTEVVSGVQVYDGPECFTLVLDARPYDDLVARNSHLSRVGIIDLPEPSGVNPDSVRLDLELQLGEAGDLEHAFRIRHATGFWEHLRNDTNKRILTELLLSKFIAPLHERQTLWPHADEEVEI